MEKGKQNKIFVGISVGFLILTIVTDILYMTKSTLTYKTIASLVFVVWSLTNLILMFKFKHLHNKKFMIAMFIGQIFACIGDIVLEIDFPIGAIFFAIGHVVFVVAYMLLQKFHITDLIYMGVCVAISLAIIFISKIQLGNMFTLVIAYAIIISCMLGKSLTLFKGNKILASVIAIGSLMFFLSDMFLMFTRFGNMGTIGGALCLIFYYPAEFVLASSIGTSGLAQSEQEPNKKYD